MVLSGGGVRRDGPGERRQLPPGYGLYGPDGLRQGEIRLTAKLDREDIPSLSLTLTRYDGDHCLAALDGETVAYVKRSQAVDLIEAIHAVVLTG